MIICTCSSAVIAASALWFDDYCCYRLRWGLNNGVPHTSNAMKFNDVCRFSERRWHNDAEFSAPSFSNLPPSTHTRMGEETADGFSALIWFRFRASAPIERILYIFSVEFNYLFDRTNGHGDPDLIVDVGSEWITDTSIIDGQWTEDVCAVKRIESETRTKHSRSRSEDNKIQFHALVSLSHSTGMHTYIVCVCRFAF